MVANEEKPHLSLCTVGHVDSGKSSSVGRLVFDLGGISEREMEKYQKEADRLGKSSFAFAFFMDTSKEERARGVTISCTTKEFFTENFHYTIVDCPGHRDFIKNMITGSSQADVGLLLVPADGNFTTALQKGNPKEGEFQGQSRAHARLLNLLGVKQLIVGVNKMDAADWAQSRFTEVSEEAKNVLIKVGWKKDFVENSVPIIPYSAMKGENMVKPATSMPWWKGCTKKNLNGADILCGTITECLNNFVVKPVRKIDAPLRVPISGIYNIKGVGTILTGLVEQGKFSPGEEVLFLPTHTTANPCQGKIFTIEMHHKTLESAEAGNNIGMSVKGLEKANMPHKGDVMIRKNDDSLKLCQSFTAQVQTLDIPNEIKVGYSPVGFVRCGHSACKLIKINWKVGKETGGKKAEDPFSLKANEMAEVVFSPIQPLIVDTNNSCDGLSRIAFMDGNAAVILGKVTAVEEKVEVAKGAASTKAAATPKAAAAPKAKK
jgi:elongation factor 1-alpha